MARCKKCGCSVVVMDDEETSELAQLRWALAGEKMSNIQKFLSECKKANKQMLQDGAPFAGWYDMLNLAIEEESKHAELAQLREIVTEYTNAKGIPIAQPTLANAIRAIIGYANAVEADCESYQDECNVLAQKRDEARDFAGSWYQELQRVNAELEGLRHENERLYGALEAAYSAIGNALEAELAREHVGHVDVLTPIDNVIRILRAALAGKEM